ISATIDNTVYAIGTDDAVWVKNGSDPWVSLGGYVKQISTGTDAAGNPEIFAIGVDDVVYYKDLGPWVSLGRKAKQISATMNNTVYAIGVNNAVYGHPSFWTFLGGDAKQISASLDATGKPEVFGIGLDDALWVNHGSWINLGDYVTEVSAPAVDVGFSGDLA